MEAERENSTVKWYFEGCIPKVSVTYSFSDDRMVVEVKSGVKIYR
jgi:hypothetical protein